ncbi:MAG: glucose-1-phosphate adenylyltransferase [Candidatus Omnitrophica bacterium]|nr:glucose-1-phosphate adenylyltransferase [Candidatus Omnitrophota bacterium]
MKTATGTRIKNTLTFIMAGGKGERLMPLTRDRAKPAVPFGGIFRIIDFTLSNCINSGIRKIHVLTQYRSISLVRHLWMGWNIFDAELGEYIDIVHPHQRAEEHWYQGTADSVYQNIYSIEAERLPYVLVLAGDHIYKMNYAQMLEFHTDAQADATVGVVRMPISQAPSLGVADLDRQQRIVRFTEKPLSPQPIPGDPGHIYASMGIYLFNRDPLEEELSLDAKSASDHDFGRNILPNCLEHGRRVMGYLLEGGEGREAYWRDVGTLDAYYEANMDLIQVTPVFNLYDRDWPIRTYMEQNPPAKFVFSGGENPSRVGRAIDSLVSGGCILSGGSVARSILSPKVRVHSYSEISDSILLEGVEAGRHCRIRRAIIDKEVKIPPNTVIGFNPAEDRKRFEVTDSGITVVAKGTALS